MNTTLYGQCFYDLEKRMFFHPSSQMFHELCTVWWPCRHYMYSLWSTGSFCVLPRGSQTDLFSKKFLFGWGQLFCAHKRPKVYTSCRI